MKLSRRNPPASPTGMTPVPDQKIGTKKNPAEAGWVLLDYLDTFKLV
jgi:hypothetical protein